MDKKGSFTAQVYTSRAELPVENAAVTILTADENNSRIISHSLTDSSGKTKPVFIDTPAIELSQAPGNEYPFTSVNVKIDHPEFYGVLIRDVQIFSDTETLQIAALIPIEETNSRHDVTETVNITPQNL